LIELQISESPKIQDVSGRSRQRSGAQEVGQSMTNGRRLCGPKIGEARDVEVLRLLQLRILQVPGYIEIGREMCRKRATVR
jgi:hypothetical protein